MSEYSLEAISYQSEADSDIERKRDSPNTGTSQVTDHQEEEDEFDALLQSTHKQTWGRKDSPDHEHSRTEESPLRFTPDTPEFPSTPLNSTVSQGVNTSLPPRESPGVPRGHSTPFTLREVQSVPQESSRALPEDVSPPDDTAAEDSSSRQIGLSTPHDRNEDILQPPLLNSESADFINQKLPPDPFERHLDEEEEDEDDEKKTDKANDGDESDDEEEDAPEDGSLRSRSPNLANLMKRHLQRGQSPPKSPDRHERASTANTTVGVFINGKLSGHSEMRSILTSHYLAINSLGVLGHFAYRVRVTELPDCVAVMNCGDIVIADNCSDIKRLKFFDSNQRYQRGLPLIPEDDVNAKLNPPFITDIQLTENDTRVWLCDNANQLIREMDVTTGETLQCWPEIGSSNRLLNPGKIAVTTERVYVCDAGDEYVKVYRRDGGKFEFKFRLGENPGSCPWSIHWTLDETLLIGDLRFSYIYIVDQLGKQLGRIGGEGRDPSRFLGPVCICSDGDGNVAIADAKNGRVQILTRDMLWITELYPVDEAIDVSSVALSSDGMLVVLDHFHNDCLIF